MIQVSEEFLRQVLQGAMPDEIVEQIVQKCVIETENKKIVLNLLQITTI